MLTIVVMSGCAVLAAVITLSRLMGFRRLLGLGTALDVAFSLAILAGFAGTITGLLIATVSGLMMALFVTACRRIFGYEKPVIYWSALRPHVMWIKQERTKLTWKAAT